MKAFRKRNRLILAAIVLLAGVIGYVMHLASAPVTGRQVAAGKLAPITPLRQPAKVQPPALIETAYFKLQLPEGYRIQEGSAAIPGLLYQQTLTKSSSSGSTIIALAVKQLPEGGLKGDSSYALREQQTGRYRLSQQTVNGEVIAIASDMVSGGTVAFWPHGDRLATIGLSSGVSTPGRLQDSEQEAIMRSLLQAWQWQ